jgi:hypothetical protein
MNNIDNIIADIENVNQTYDFWIRDENGNIKDDVICGEVIPFLEELKDYEIDMSQDEIKDMMNFWDSNFNKPKYERNNTYNYNANIDHDIDYRIVESGHDGVWFAFMVHRYGDVRGNILIGQYANLIIYMNFGNLNLLDSQRILMMAIRLKDILLI